MSVINSSFGGGGGIKINGIIEQYQAAAGMNISAGDFVRFVNEVGTLTQLSTIDPANDVISAVLLSTNKVFVSFFEDQVGHNLYAVVVTINGTNITAGTTTSIHYDKDLYVYNVSVVKLDSNKVFVAFINQTRSSNGYHWLRGVVATINGTTISPGQETELRGDVIYGDGLSATLIASNKILVLYSVEDWNEYLYGVVVTISGTTITPGTETQLSTLQFSGKIISSATLENNKAFIGYAKSGDALYGMVVTISGTAITPGTQTLCQSDNYTSKYKISVSSLSESKVFIAHAPDNDGYNTSYKSVWGNVAAINGTEIEFGQKVALHTDSKYTCRDLCAVSLNENAVFVACTFYQNDGDLKDAFGVVVDINGNSITKRTTTHIADGDGPNTNIIAALYTLLLSENKVFIAYGYGSNRYLHGHTMFIDSISLYDGVNIDGVAATSANAGGTINVYTPI